LEDIDFGAAMTPAAKPEPQTRMAQVVEGDPIIIGEIALPIGTDVRPTALSLVPYQEKVLALKLAAKELQVTDDASRKKATELALQAKKLRIRVEKIEDSPAVQAAINFVKDVRHLLKTLTTPLKQEVEQVCKNKLTAYAEHLRLAQERRDAEARERARILQGELDAEAAKLKAEAEAKAQAAEEELAQKEAAGEVNDAERAILQQTVEEEREAAASIVAPIVTVEVRQSENVVRTSEGSSFTTTRWIADLVDINLVDRKYLMVNPKAIQKDVDGGLRKADGFNIHEISGTSLRG
jgi:hypothetical protein